MFASSCFTDLHVLADDASANEVNIQMSEMS